MPKVLREDLSRAGANDLNPERPFQIFQDWSKSQKGKIEVDRMRLANAMEHSGITRNVNWINTWIIGQMLGQPHHRTEQAKSKVALLNGRVYDEIATLASKV